MRILTLRLFFMRLIAHTKIAYIGSIRVFPARGKARMENFVWILMLSPRTNIIKSLFVHANTRAGTTNRKKPTKTVAEKFSERESDWMKNAVCGKNPACIFHWMRENLRVVAVFPPVEFSRFCSWCIIMMIN